MTLKDRLNDDLRSALRSGDEPRKTTLRGVIAAIRHAEDAAVKARLTPAELNWEGDAGREGDPPRPERTVTVSFDDDDVAEVLRRQVKQRHDSIEQFQRAGRGDLVEKESAELAILQEYLPRSMARDEIAAQARAVIAETGAAGPSDKGKVMPVIMKRLAGKAEGRDINAVVTELLAKRE